VTVLCIGGWVGVSLTLMRYLNSLPPTPAGRALGITLAAGLVVAGVTLYRRAATR
jgi:hypothetical protein